MAVKTMVEATLSAMPRKGRAGSGWSMDGGQTTTVPGSRKGLKAAFSPHSRAGHPSTRGLTNTLCDSDVTTGVSDTSCRAGGPAGIAPWRDRQASAENLPWNDRAGRFVPLKAATLILVCFAGAVADRQSSISRVDPEPVRPWSPPAHRGDPYAWRLDDLPPSHHARGDPGAAAVRLAKLIQVRRILGLAGALLHPHPLHALRRRSRGSTSPSWRPRSSSGSTC